MITKTERVKASDFKPKKSEHDIQKVCVEWFRLKYPKYLIYAIPNGGKREKKVNSKGVAYSGEANRLKAEGVLAGVPDLHIPVAKQGFHGLYIEMKSCKKKPDPNQITVMEKLTNEGFRCEVCWSLDDFIKMVDNYFNAYTPI